MARTAATTDRHGSRVTTALDDLAVWITGADSGVGRGLALECVASQAQLVLLGRSLSGIDRTIESVSELGGSARAFCCDETEVNQITEVLDQVGAPDVLVNCVGASLPQSFTEVDDRSYEMGFDATVRATFFTTQTIVRRWLETGTAGVIVNILSPAGHHGAQNSSVGETTRQAVEGLTRALAGELGPYGIRVNAIAPAFTVSPMSEELLQQPEFRREAMRRIPLERLGTMHDIAGAVAYLSDSGTAFVTGQCLVLDGGFGSR